MWNGDRTEDFGPRGNLVDLAYRWMGLWKGHYSPARFDELHDPSFVDHASEGRATDREGFRSGIEALYRAFPDFAARVNDVLVDEERQSVAIRWTATGTHSGEFMGHPPTGRSIEFAGIEIIRRANGRVTERWGRWNGLALEAQMRASSA